MILGGVVLIGSGLLYLRQPTLFRRGIWMKTSIAIRLLSEQAYIKYMKGLGIVFIILGVGLIAAAVLQLISN
jgi:hypothetical protein